MLKHLTVAANLVEPETWGRHETEDVLNLITELFPGSFPDNARLYHMSVCQANDITPGAETVKADIERIQSLEGPFFLMVYPEAPVLPYLFALALAVAAYVFAPGVPRAAAPVPLALARNQQAASPNNELSDRSNRPRINGRIPDIYGTVRSTPDLIAVPYKIFENNREVEYAYMCIGRGPYEVSSIRDGETQAVNIGGTSVMVYEPYTSPNSYDPNTPGVGDPTTVVGELRREPVVSARRSNSVNGQVLRPPNEVFFSYDEDFGGTQIRFRYPNQIEMPQGSPQDFTKFFVEGDIFELEGASMDGSPITVRLNFKAMRGNLVYTYSGGSKTFSCGTGALLFPASQIDMLSSIFPNGGNVTLLTGSVTSIGDISGDYVVQGTPAVYGPDNAAQQAAGIPTYFIVKFVNADTENPNWLNINAPTSYFSNFTYTTSPFNIDLDGTGYEITSVTKEILTIDNPSAINADWEDVLSIETVTPFLNATMTTQGDKWVGPFILADGDATQVFCNFVASNGLYKDDGTAQAAAEVEVEVELTPVDLDDLPLGDPQLFQISLIGSTFLKETVASTLKANPSEFYGRMAIRARRVTPSDFAFDGQVVDEVRWRDVYSIAPVAQEHFGNVTTVFSVTLATASALAVKDRKLNMLVSRKIPTYVDGVFTEILATTSDTPLILAAVCRDKYIGNRQVSELDITNFFDCAIDAENYFGIDVVRNFNYTFDKEETSFEETVDTIAKAMFCIAYRRGSVIRLSFEKATEDSTLLFNHRNKIPGSESRVVTFGGASVDNDGIEYTYVDPQDDSINTIFLPPAYAARNPKKIESIGIRDHLQAYFHAWRIWNRLKFQNQTVEFEATQEASLLVVNDRILVSDGTRANIQDGQVEEVDGLEITLSQKVDLTADAPYTIFLQHFDATVEAIEITAGSAANKVVLADAPLMDLVTAAEMYAKTTYLIVGNADVTQKAFLVNEKSAEEGMKSTVKAVNYHAGYYGNDTDYINELIGLNGYDVGGGYTPADNDDDGYVSPPIVTLAGSFNPTGLEDADGSNVVGYAINNSSNAYPDLGDGTHGGVLFDWETLATSGGMGALDSIVLPSGLTVGFVGHQKGGIPSENGGFFLVIVSTVGAIAENRLVSVRIIVDETLIEFPIEFLNDSNAGTGTGYNWRFWYWTENGFLEDANIYPLEINMTP